MSDRVEPLSPVKRALVEIREMRGRLEAADAERHEPIAVVGIGCRFPGGVTDPESFWTLLAEGHDAIGEVPTSRWDIDAFFDANPSVPGKMATRSGGFLDDIDRFDHGFFGISPREADSMDPQQRLALEVTWEALEHAGISPDALRGEPVGIFVGAAASDYFQLLLRRSNPVATDAYVASGGALGMIAGRLAYVLGTQGPAMVIDTACSSSLVAIHQACRSLRQRESRMAIAGGVGLILLPELTVNFSQARMLSADGRCKTFDAAADGYVRGEGCGVVVLKRLGDALRDGNRVLAVVRGSAVNQDGRSSGLTVPNGVAQESVIRSALGDARLSFDEIDYVEAHGTGTALGDPIEVLALARALRPQGVTSDALLVGSVKTNIGHLEAAAGIAGFIKLVLALERGALPPSLHFNTPNPHIDWGNLPVRVVSSLIGWPVHARPRRAGVSSFGFSGTNAHVVLESAPESQASPLDGPAASLLVLSARTHVALRTKASLYAHHFQNRPHLETSDVCFTAARGRKHFPARLAVVGRDLDELRIGLEEFLESTIEVPECSEPRIVFAFPGHGSELDGLARTLYASSELFRGAIDRCSRALIDVVDPPLATLVAGGGDAGLRHRPRYLQPAVFAFEYALASLWQSWGIRPAAVVGHSLGEYAAACVAGVMTPEDAIRLVAERGRLTETLSSTGAMAAILADEATVRSQMSGCVKTVTIAGLNGPTNTVISGAANEVWLICDALASRGVESRPLSVPYGFHSPEMAPIVEPLAQAARRVTFSRQSIPFASSLRGCVLHDDERLSAEYWRDHARDAVRFADAIGALVASGCTHFIEVGPRATLCGLGRRLAHAHETLWLPSVVDVGSEWDQLLTSLGRLYAAGAEVDWHGVFPQRRRIVPLPTYPFERTRHWFDEGPGTRATVQSHGSPASVWARMADAARRQSETAPFDLALSTFPDKWRALHARSLASLEATLARLGAFSKAGESLRVDDVMERCRIRPGFRQLVERWLAHLVTSGHLEQQDSRFLNRVAFSVVVPQPSVDRVAAAFHDYPELLRYFESCVSRLESIMTGAVSPLDTLFPEGDCSIAEGLYGESCVARYVNRIVSSTVSTVATAQASGRRFRILEIGAGTGSTTRAVLPTLDRSATDYVFTDVGPLFLVKAAERLADFPFVSFERLDIESEEDVARMAADGYDVVIAANVLHATRDLSVTLRHVRQLLAPGGALIAIESTDYPVWLDLTTGLIAGWQRFADRWRRDHPLLPVDAWSSALAAAGFSRVDAWPAAGSPAAVLGQHVIIAQSENCVVTTSAPLSESPRQVVAAPTAPLQDATNVAAQLRECAPQTRRRQLVQIVRAEVMQVLRLSSSETPLPQQRLMELGIDSLMAVELRNRLKVALALEAPLTATLIFDYPTIGAIAEYIDSVLAARVGAVASNDFTARARAEELAALDDEAVAELVDARLRNLG